MKKIVILCVSLMFYASLHSQVIVPIDINSGIANGVIQENHSPLYKGSISNLNEPDLDVCYIKRLPEINYVDKSSHPETEGWPSEGQQIKWRAYVKNWSPNKVVNVKYKWVLNGTPILTGYIASIESNSLAYADLDYSWSFERKELEFVIDPDNSVQETTKLNNSLLIYTNSISLNLYVEQSLYDYFHLYQSNLNVGTNSWEDWAQILQVKRWNRMFDKAIFPETSKGVNDRIRIDSIIILPDGSLPLHLGLPSNSPNADDKTVDLQWGYVSSQNNFDSYKNTTNVSDNNPFYFEGSLLHELGHARYLIDTYGFDVGNGPINGIANIQIQEKGSSIVGTSYMPFLAWDVVHYNNHQGLMSGDYNYIDLYSAMALNLIAGHRATNGNMNAPGNIGAFLNDLPSENIITLKDQNGILINNASVKVYRTTQNATWYGKYYDSIPDIELITNSNGEVSLGKCPFDSNGRITHTFGLSNGVIILRVEKQGKIGYNFLESTEFNLEYWRGNVNIGRYEMRFNLINNPDISVKITFPDASKLIAKGSIIPVTAETPVANFKKIDFFIDNQLIGTKTQAPFIIDWNTSGYSLGYHKVRVLLTDNSDNTIFNEIICILESPLDCLPSKANMINGTANLCLKPVIQTYTTTRVPNAITYIWAISPTNAGTITGTDTMATVEFNTSFIGTAQITVKGRNTCGDGAENSLAIKINDIPSAASGITGNVTVCKGGTETYSVSVITGATSYIWTLPIGTTGTSTTNTISLNYGNNSASGNLKVKGHNDCGDGVESTLAITVCLGVGIDDAVLSDLVEVFPNPTQDVFYTTINKPFINDFKVEVSNNYGQVLQTILKHIGDNKFSIDLTNYPKGIYVIRFSDKETHMYCKIVKQ